MKKLTTVWIIALFLTLIVSIGYTSDISSVNPILEKIRAGQQISSQEKINPDLVNNEQLESLGKALSVIIYPDPDQLSMMKDMIGDDGSPALRTWYRFIAFKYLSSGQSMSAIIDMMCGMGAHPWGVMYHNVFMMHYWWQIIIPAFLLIVVIPCLIFLLVHHFLHRKDHPKIPYETALEILHRRYVSGELTQEEFEAMKGHIGEE